MRRILKWIGIGLGAILLVGVIAALALYSIGRSRLNRTYNLQVDPVPIDDDPATLARGEHLLKAVSACNECHDQGLRGQAFFDDPALGTVVSANLTRGQGGVGDQYTDTDWVRAIRHAVDPDGKPLLAMPSQRFNNMSAEDLGAVIAYVKSVPPADNEPPSTDLTPLAYILTALGQLDALITVEQIDHDVAPPQAPPAGPTQEYGRYLVSIATCRDCHGEELAGGQAAPGEPIGPNLTPAGDLSAWTQEDFFRLIRTGQRPDGRQIIDFMPWRYYQDMTDEELEAIWLYLQSLEPRQTPSQFVRGQ